VRDSLLAGGMRADMPVAMIENASLPQQRTCYSQLQGMQQAALDFQLKSPAILLIGEVAVRSANACVDLLPALLNCSA
jgi:uroporphyrin-III C-methyltransferase